jgi:ketosteroid isomerase-like protein
MRIALLVAVAVLLLTPTVWAQEAGQDTFTGEVKALLAKHNAAFSAQDMNAVMALYSAEPQTYLMGTGEGEWYVGHEGIRGAYTSFCAGFTKDSLKIDYSTLTAARRGNAGFFMAMSTLEGKTATGEARKLSVNWSGVVSREDGVWKLRAVHFSHLMAAE